MSLGKSETSSQGKELIEIKYRFRPGLFFPVFTTLVFIAPYLWLFVDIAEKRYDRLVMLALLSGFGVSAITLAWTFYIIELLRYKREVKSYLKDPKTYEW